MWQRILARLDTKGGFCLSVGVISAASAVLRLVRITFPDTRVFDELWSPVFARKILEGHSFFDIHPILAQLPHAIGLTLLGDTPLGWRCGPWLWAILFVWAAAIAAWLLTNRPLAGVFAALLVSLDTGYFVYGRTGLPDMFLLSQLALSIMFFLLSVRVRSRWRATLAGLVCGLFLGNVVATKWLGLAVLGVVWSWIVIFAGVRILQKRGLLQDAEVLLPNIPLALYPFCFLLLPGAVYFAWLIPMLGWQGSWGEMWDEIVWWHISVWEFNACVPETFPGSSKWWEWPLVIHPLNFVNEKVDNGRFIITAIGNVWLWWTSLAALIGSCLWLLRKFRPVVLWLIVSALGFWLPWAAIPRMAFNYHYFETLFFEILLLALIFTNASDRPRYRPYILGYFALTALCFVLLYPTVTGVYLPDWIPVIPFFAPY